MQKPGTDGRSGTDPQERLTVHEVSRMTGVSIRTLHYYDEIGLLMPSEVTESGYRLYHTEDLERLQTILFYRELQFPLREIRAIMDSPAFERGKALDGQIRLLEMRCEHLQDLIRLARDIRDRGEMNLNFKPFDTTEMDQYAEEVRKKWGHTEAYREFEEKHKGEAKDAGKGLMEIIAVFHQLKDVPPEDSRVQTQVTRLQQYITGHFYTCTREILAGLGRMYVSDERMKANIDAFGGEGTAETAARAIETYCRKG